MCGGNGKPTNTIITLTVNTDGITTSNVNDHVVFTDNQSDPAENPGHPETYVSTVNKGATCEWQGVAVNGRDEINIATVVKKAAGGNDILKTPIPPGLQNPKGGNKLTARVNGAYLSGNEKYTVSFTINDDSTVYPVDPSLRMNN